MSTAGPPPGTSVQGLLHRLAARATGTAWTVRSDARLPYGAAPAFEGDAAQHLAPLLAPDAMPLQPTPATRPDAAGEEPQPAPRQGTPGVATVPADGPARPAPAATRPPHAAEPLAGPALQQPHALHATGVRAQQPTMPGTPALPAMRASGADTENTAHATVARPPRAGSATGPRDEPAPLLPRVRAQAAHPIAAATAPPTATRRQGGTATPAAPQDTEVHIHIGRIDVTALHEAPQPKPRPRERTQPVSLDAYLARRGDKR